MNPRHNTSVVKVCNWITLFCWRGWEGVAIKALTALPIPLEQLALAETTQKQLPKCNQAPATPQDHCTSLELGIVTAICFPHVCNTEQRFTWAVHIPPSPLPTGTAQHHSTLTPRAPCMYPAPALVRHRRQVLVPTDKRSSIA